jgi:hypothetical protein
MHKVDLQKILNEIDQLYIIYEYEYVTRWIVAICLLLHVCDTGRFAYI